MSHKKFGPDRFSRFDVYWIQTDRQTDRQAKFIYRLIFIAFINNIKSIVSACVGCSSMICCLNLNFIILKNHKKISFIG